MSYFRKHRYNIKKYFHMRGEEKTQSTKNQKAEVHSSGVIRKMQVQGNTYQDESMNVQSMNGDGVSVTVRGINIYNAVSKTSRVVENIVITRQNNIFCINGTHNDRSTVNGILCNVANIKPDVTYSVRLKQISGEYKNAKVSFYCYTNSPLTFKKVITSMQNNNIETVGTFTVTEEDLSKGIMMGVYFAELNENAEYLNCCIRADIVEGGYTKETFPDFEDYIEPKTMKIDTELHGIDGYNDILTLDFANNRVEAKRKVKVVNLVDLIDENAEIMSNNGENAITIRLPYIWQEGTKSYCSHCKSYGEIGSNKELCFEFIKGSETNLYFYWIEQTTVDEFYNWALENNVKIAFVTEDERIENIDFKLPKDFLPYNATSVIEADGSNGINVAYYDFEERN